MQFLLFCFFLFSALPMFANTLIVVTKQASLDGSVLLAQTEEDEQGDHRIFLASSADFAANSKKEIYPNGSSAQEIPLGSIDQVSHTFSYLKGFFPIMNEHQLSIGHCNCLSFFHFEKDPKNRLLKGQDLATLALERCTKAKEAAETMGSLADTYGYYGEAKTFVLADPEEAWVLEICSSPKGKGALWVAKKIPNGEVFVAANQFRIREVSRNDSDTLCSIHLFKVAEEEKLWDSKSNVPLDWLKITSPGEYFHPYDSLRRIWRLQSNIAPSLNLSPWVEHAFTKTYPFSLKPDKKLSHQDLISLLRDHFEGTPFDLCKGLASGPFGSPDRYIGPYDQTSKEGAWERPISHFSCNYSYVTQSRNWLPDAIGGICWIGFDAPSSTCYIPLYSSIQTLPAPFHSTFSQDFNKKSAFWLFNFVSNWMNLKYDQMMKDLKDKQTFLESALFADQINVETLALETYKKNPFLVKEYLTKTSLVKANHVIEEWISLSNFLIEKYIDGFENKPELAKTTGYPKWWRDQVGYTKGPVSYEKPKEP